MQLATEALRTGCIWLHQWSQLVVTGFSILKVGILTYLLSTNYLAFCRCCTCVQEVWDNQTRDTNMRILKGGEGGGVTITVTQN